MSDLLDKDFHKDNVWTQVDALTVRLRILEEALTNGSQAGAQFPLNPTPGQAFYRTDLNAPFWFDGFRSRWLGELEQFFFNYLGTRTSGVMLRMGNTTSTSPTHGYYIPYPLAIVGMTQAHTGSGSAPTDAFRLERNNAPVFNLPHNNQIGVDMGLNESFDGLAAMRVRLVITAGTVVNPVVIVYARRTIL